MSGWFLLIPNFTGPPPNSRVCVLTPPHPTPKQSEPMRPAPLLLFAGWRRPWCPPLAVPPNFAKLRRRLSVLRAFSADSVSVSSHTMAIPATMKRKQALPAAARDRAA